MSLLTVKNLNYYYQDGDTRRYILKDIDYTFERGKFYVVLGESGSGKTTFLSLLCGLDTPKSGDILYENDSIKKIGYTLYRKNKVSIIFQSYNLVPHLSAIENVKVAMGITTNELPKDIDKIAYNLLDYIGITKEKADRLVNKLSGGEQQRVAIARSLSTNCDVILADEPTGNLDEDMEVEIIDILKKLAHEHDKCVIVVTHSNEIAKEADLVIKLKKGKFDQNE